jgi:phosphopantetheinyl transferase (holo-ACP synthase)
VRRFDIVRSHLSLTDEREYALAFVVLEKMSTPLPK